MIELEFSFEYRNFYIEGMPLDQTENGHPEDAITSAELFGICPECDAVMHEEGCIVCKNYES